jgi:hypothetical protein
VILVSDLTNNGIELIDPNKHDDDYILRRDVDPNPLSESSLSVVRNWLQKCFNSHQDCAKDQAYTPTRLIDVSGTDPFLVSLSGSNKTKYTALSHCWGGKSTAITTLENIEDHLCLIPMNSMPQNFRDAIVVTKRLGIQYLWLDSLCIIQNSEEDWLLQSSHMRSIYENAFLTISALDAVDSYSGFLYNRSENRAVSITGAGSNLYARNPQPAWDEIFDPAPLVSKI